MEKILYYMKNTKKLVQYGLQGRVHKTAYASGLRVFAFDFHVVL